MCQVLEDNELERVKADCVRQLTANTDFLPMIQDSLRKTHDFYRDAPNYLKLVSNLDRWMLTGLIQRCWFLCRQTDGSADLYATVILDEAEKYGLLSPNSVRTVLKELMAYGLLNAEGKSSDGRRTRLTIPPFVQGNIKSWILGHLQILDALTDGQHLQHVEERDDFFYEIQSNVAYYLTTSSQWRNPAVGINLFYQVKHGAWLLEKLICRIDPKHRAKGHYIIGGIARTELARELRVSRTTMHRIFSAALSQGVLFQQGTDLFLKKEFVDSFLRWQAYKFAAYDLALKSFIAKTASSGS